MSDLHQLRALCQSVANGEPHADHGGVWQGERQTVIARYGDDGPEYLSGLVFADTNEHLAEAKRRAAERGLLKEAAC